MLVISRTTFKIIGDTDRIFSKLQSKVTQVQTLIHPILNSTIATSRPWVGKFDRDHGRFEIIQTTRFFSSRIMEGNFFRLFILGQIVEDVEQSKINIEFKLGMRATLLFILIGLFSLLVVVNFFRSGTWVSLMIGLLPLIIMMSLLTAQVNRTDRALKSLFS
jgi:hypothetical protein